MSAAQPVSPPFFLVTIDTEGDNLWAAPKEITTRNSGFLSRFQDTCERYGIRPTYLTNYEMVQCGVFREFAHDVLRRNAGEVGMHLHAWNSPPIEPLTPDDFAHLPYLVEYSERVMREKIRVMTAELEEAFSVKMCSHRAGRWNIDRRYVALLIEAGYSVDCSVTPGISWRQYKGNPMGEGGADYTRFPHHAYWMGPSDISTPGIGSSLLEVPMTILQAEDSLWESWRNTFRRLRSAGLGKSGSDRQPERAARWLRPNGRNRREMISTIKIVCAERRQYAEFMLHSSELMPGGSPTFRTPHSIDRLYDDLHALFSEVQRTCISATLAEFQQVCIAGRLP